MPSRQVSIKRLALWALLFLTGLQIAGALAALYLWGFGLVEMPKYAAVPLLFGPWLTGFPAAMLWEER